MPLMDTIGIFTHDGIRNPHFSPCALGRRPV